ncbi:ABC transporter permease [Chitiniphilus purpureus]|uniref:ABC transporter permease n=1 Tax=Chitiniphilus purpureus TaxID=2981137 RepID=A0ABY6DNW0_9NEIS|nr:ABC transporter permease [Chitiniphilus sp. CD1]UXY16055.1 ABC transporter permease [Chitiniphilus sp. CD1]
MRLNPASRDWRGLVLPAVFLTVWALVTQAGWVDTRLIVPPEKVLAVAWDYVAGGTFLKALAASLWRDGAGFVTGAAAGILLGSLLGVSRWAERLLGPTFHAVRQISLFAWIPLLSIWLGYNDTSRIVFVAVSVFYPVTLATFDGVRSITRAQLEVAQVYAFTGAQRFTRLILPAASPQIIAGLNLGLVYAWLATIGAEFLLPAYGEVGLGDTVIRGRAAFNVELVVFGMVLIGTVGALLNQLATRLEARALRWRGDR